jgi:predicted nucleic acid-binding protein
MTTDGVRLSFDTNVMVYAEGLQRVPDDSAKIALAQRLVSNVDLAAIAISAQSLGELFNVLRRRGERSPERASFAVERWATGADVIATDTTLMRTAIDLASRHCLAIWDAVVLAAAAEARCDLLLSEDMQHGFVWRGVEVVNPFLADPHPMLAGLLAP